MFQAVKGAIDKYSPRAALRRAMGDPGKTEAIPAVIERHASFQKGLIDDVRDRLSAFNPLRLLGLLSESEKITKDAARQKFAEEQELRNLTDEDISNALRSRKGSFVVMIVGMLGALYYIGVSALAGQGLRLALGLVFLLMFSVLMVRLRYEIWMFSNRWIRPFSDFWKE